jgi:hypothetical protein
MKISWILRLTIAFLAIGSCLYFHIDQNNEITRLKIQIPALLQQLHTLKEENRQLQYSIDSFESPENLLQFAQQPAYAHLKHPLTKEVLTITDTVALDSSPAKPSISAQPSPQASLAKAP